jgi:hypothetical protein
MEKIKFEIQINATPEKVWNVLWDDATYFQWTSAFGEGGKAVSDWQEGSKIFFLASDGSGMVSEIARKIPNRFMSFTQFGTVDKNLESTESEEAREWLGARENYTLEPENNGTFLTVDMDILEKYKNYFSETWPGAMQKIKELSEIDLTFEAKP